jgi:tetratricopeptide (TPR) repeat protein
MQLFEHAQRRLIRLMNNGHFACAIARSAEKDKSMIAPKTCIPILAALLLTACATDGSMVRNEPHPAMSLDRALAEADTAVSAGQNDKAMSVLKNAATTYPADKTPWLHMAQLKFDHGSYGEAIIDAQEALQRDPADKLGNSIVAVSGLRLSTKALADLSQQNNLNGSLRSEAQELAKLLRSSLGEDVLVPTQGAAQHKPVAPLKKAASTAAAPARNSKSNNQANADPFDALK